MTQEILLNDPSEISFQGFVESEIKKKALFSLPIASETVFKEDEIKQLVAEAVEENNLDPDKIVFMLTKGFGVQQQLESGLTRIATRINAGYTFDQAREAFIQEVTQDLSSFVFEFLKQEPVLVNPLTVIDTKYGRKVVGGDYNEIPIEEVTSASDRDGATEEAVELLAANLPYVKPNSMFVITSPKGWSGVEGTSYPETQIYLYLVNGEGKLDAITVRSEMNLDECEKFIAKLVNNRFQPSTASESERIKHVVKSLAYVETNGEDGFETVVSAMQEVSGKVAFKRDGKEVTYSQIKEKLKEVKMLFQLDIKAREIVLGLQNYIRIHLKGLSKSDIVNIGIALGKAALDLLAVMRPQSEPIASFVSNDSTPEILDYRRLKEELAGQLGCEPELDAFSSIYTPLGNRKFESTQAKHVKNCPFCGKYYDRVLNPGYKCDCGQTFLGAC